MAVYVILDIDVHDPGQFSQYQAQAPAIIEKYQGKYLVRGGDVIALGEWQPKRIVVLEFPSFEKLQAFVSAPEYEAVKRIRIASASSRISGGQFASAQGPSPRLATGPDSRYIADAASR